MFSKSFAEKSSFFTPQDDYINLSEAVRDYPNIYEIKINSNEEYQTKLERLHTQLESVPLFVIANDQNIYLLSEFESKGLSAEGIKLIYIGDKI